MRSHFSCSTNRFKNVHTALPPTPTLLQLCHSPQHAETNALNKRYKNVFQASLQRLFPSPFVTLSFEQNMPDALTQRHTGPSAQQHPLYRGAGIKFPPPPPARQGAERPGCCHQVFFFLQGKAPNEIHAILTETLTYLLHGEDSFLRS